MWRWFETKDIPPGFFRDRTDYFEGPKWVDGQWVRFRAGVPQKIGGYSKIISTALGTQSQGNVDAKARNMLQWRELDGDRDLAIATHCGVWVYNGGSLYDVTPIRATTTPTNPYDTTSGSPTVTVNETSHGALIGDRINITSASAVGGLTLSGDYGIQTVPDANSFTITAASNASSTVSGGGGTPTHKYTINCGSKDGTTGLGWGAENWGEGTWGTARTAGIDNFEIQWISLANWGEDLIMSFRNGDTYLWDSSAGTSTRAAAISSNDPTQVGLMLISDTAPHLIYFGAHDGSAFDPLLIKWSDEEDYDTWAAAVTNTAGDIKLRNGNKIAAAIHARNSMLVWTDTALYSMAYVGSPFQFGVQPLGNTTILGPGAAVHYNSLSFWMGDGNFYMYDGTIKSMKCPVRDYVFDNLNRAQKEKVYGWVNDNFNEIWWFYCSANSTENDSYVVYNWEDDAWTTGTIQRNAAVSARLWENPIAMDTSGFLYQHEAGWNDEDGDGITANILSGPIEIATADNGAGQYMMFCDKHFPDLNISDDKTLQFSVHAKKFPQSTATIKGPVSINSKTKYFSKRARGRQFQFKWESTDEGNDWRLGNQRTRFRPDGIEV
jgi:hypothetical protein